MEDEAPRKKQPAGAPAWLGTFADLMSLLLAFFVLLFSFSELDKAKFKELSGSMRDAFGVQRTVPQFQPPVGTTLIARDFTPGRPTPTEVNVVQQELIQEVIGKLKQEEEEELEEDLEKIRKLLDVEIREGIVEVGREGKRAITIRIRETGSFDSGSATLNNDFTPVIQKIGSIIHDIGGRIAVAGHTDNLPISTARFRSNWDLSAARAATVLQSIVETSRLSPTLFQLAGLADTRPLDTNRTAAGRARNRRVEVILLRGSLFDSLYSPTGSSLDASTLSPDQP